MEGPCETGRPIFNGPLASPGSETQQSMHTRPGMGIHQWEEEGLMQTMRRYEGSCLVRRGDPF